MIRRRKKKGGRCFLGAKLGGLSPHFLSDYKTWVDIFSALFSATQQQLALNETPPFPCPKQLLKWFSSHRPLSFRREKQAMNEAAQEVRSSSKDTNEGYFFNLRFTPRGDASC